MKSRKINILLAVSLAAIIALSGCKKDDGSIRNRVTVKEVPVVTTTIDATGSQAIDMLNLAAFSGKFKVALFFPGATAPSKVDIIVRKNGSSANVRLYKAGVTAFPSSYTVTAAEIAALFGVAIALGDTYDFAPDIYVGDSKYEAFPVTGTGTGTGATAYPLFSEFARFAAICAYDPAIYQGNFVVVSDAFGDFVPGEVVVLTRISNTSFSFVNPYVTSPLPIIVNVNILNNQVTITKQKIGNAFVWNLTYTNPNFDVAASTSSFVAPCSKTLNLNILITVDQGSFGNRLLILRKP